MTLDDYLHRVLSAVFRIEAASVCADITVCAEDDCAMSHRFYQMLHNI